MLPLAHTLPIRLRRNLFQFRKGNLLFLCENIRNLLLLLIQFLLHILPGIRDLLSDLNEFALIGLLRRLLFQSLFRCLFFHDILWTGWQFPPSGNIKRNQKKRNGQNKVHPQKLQKILS